jgi:AcrR family transcriptional regulator
MRRKDDEKEQRIKDAVIALTLTEGFDGTSISKIARRAAVSPATVYVYFDSKETMLREIYREYSEDVYGYLLHGVSETMDGAALIEALMRAYYGYMNEHQEVFSFVEQCSHCPTLAGCCTERRGVCRLFGLMREMKEQHVIRNYSDENLAAVLFYPVKAIALDRRAGEEEKELRLEELIRMIQRTLLDE